MLRNWSGMIHAHMLDATQLVRVGGGCFSFGVQTSGEYISTMFGCI